MKRIVFIFILLSLMFLPVWGDIPTKMHIQGRLTDTTGNPVSGTHNFRIRLQVGTGYIFTKYYDLPGVNLENGIFDLEFGDEDLRNFDFSRGDMRLDIQVDSTYMYQHLTRVRQQIPSAPAAFCAYNLKGGKVEAEGPLLAVNTIDPAQPSYTARLCGVTFIMLGTPKSYGAETLIGSNTSAWAGRFDGSRYYGMQLSAKERSTDIALYGFGKETGVFTRGQVALKAENTSGGPALEIGQGRVQVPWSIITRTMGPFYHHQIDIAPVEWEEYAGHSGAVGVISFTNNYDPIRVRGVNEFTHTINNAQARRDSLIFLTQRPGESIGLTTVDTAEAYIKNKYDGSFVVELKEYLPRDSYAEFSFLIVNQFAVED